LHLIAIALILAVIASPCSAQSGSEPSRSATFEGALDGALIFRLVSPSIAVIHTDSGTQGSAVAIEEVNEGTAFATNCHVLAGAKTFTVATRNERAVGIFLGGHAQEDACVVFAPIKAPVPRKVNALDLLPGEKVYAVGAPRGLQLTITAGMFSARRGNLLLERPLLLQISAPISPGSSGGGLFDARGRLVGITTFALKDSQGLNFAISINTFTNLARRSKIDTLEDLNRELRTASQSEK
jgi:serine protease Do